MKNRIFATKKLGNTKDDLLIKKMLESYKKIDMERPSGFSSTEWNSIDVMCLGNYKVHLFTNSTKPIIAVDVSSIYSEGLITRFFDARKIFKMKLDDDEGSAAVLISLGYLIDRVLDEYEQGLAK